MVDWKDWCMRFAPLGIGWGLLMLIVDLFCLIWYNHDIDHGYCLDMLTECVQEISKE